MTRRGCVRASATLEPTSVEDLPNLLQLCLLHDLRRRGAAVRSVPGVHAEEESDVELEETLR